MGRKGIKATYPKTCFKKLWIFENVLMWDFKQKISAV